MAQSNVRQDYSSSRIGGAKAPFAKRPGLSLQRFCFSGINSSGTISTIGFLVIVEIVHPKHSQNYTKLAKCKSQAEENLQLAVSHAFSLSMELEGIKEIK